MTLAGKSGVKPQYNQPTNEYPLEKLWKVMMFERALGGVDSRKIKSKQTRNIFKKD